ncbi:MAG: phosphate acyltransferase PlsX [SAR202 cluster bacterium]|nr:phosphate acyltransferase PlsX [SAR202 cluster bacterium]
MTTPPNMVTIALDAMGGDFAPAETVAGAVLAMKQGGVALALVGDPAALKAELAKFPGSERLPAQIVPSEDVVREGEHPAMAFRSKPRASIFVATGVVKAGKARAVVSMGSTGATIAAATVLFGTFEGIDRAALGGPIIGTAPGTIVIDVGTNVECKPRQLADFAALGTAMSRILYGVESPRVAILSVGAEEGKGNKLVLEATPLLKQSGLNFIGNVEGTDLPFGKAEIIVCEGFSGNVVMKLTEGLGEALANDLRSHLGGKLAADEVERIATRVYELTNRAEAYGGGPLLGVKGVAVVGHGRARAQAVANAIHTARKSVQNGFVEAAAKEVARLRGKLGEPPPATA